MSDSKKKILIVDDSKFTRVSLNKIIREIEFAEIVGEALNGKEAVSLYRKLKPDLITMDLVMPNMGGIEAIEEIFKIDKSVKIIVITAIGQESMILEATQKGATEFLQKPFKKDEVINAVKRCFKK